MLLLLVALELLTMPVTQLLWKWDGFLHGGHDFELGLFVIVSCVCLALLRAQHGRQAVQWLLAVFQLCCSILAGRAAFMLLREPFSVPLAFSPPVAPLLLPSVCLRI